jgi:magnesium-protoporphyrin O-methyltransferase
LVILDRVICCYPHLPPLLGAAAGHARRYLAVSFPLDTWWLRLPARVISALMTLFRSRYHFFIHRGEEVVAIARDAGLRPVHLDRNGLWRIAVFGR